MICWYRVTWVFFVDLVVFLNYIYDCIILFPNICKSLCWMESLSSIHFNETEETPCAPRIIQITINTNISSFVIFETIKTVYGAISNHKHLSSTDYRIIWIWILIMMRTEISWKFPGAKSVLLFNFKLLYSVLTSEYIHSSINVYPVST